VYSKSADGVYVNLFVGSTIMLENAGGTDVEMVQATDYPWSGKVSITVNPKVRKRFSVRIRMPDRGVCSLYKSAPEANGITSLAVNGSAVKPPTERGYAVITRTWKAGDKIDVVLPMTPQRIRASEKIEATRNKVALRYGPLIYNIEQADQDISAALGPDSPLSTEWRGDFLGGVVVIRGQFAGGGPLLAIPNFVRMNRLAGVPLPPGPPPPDAEGRRQPRLPLSVVWIKEG
jgi:DUF1680 family protein